MAGRFYSGSVSTVDDAIIIPTRDLNTVGITLTGTPVGATVLFEGSKTKTATWESVNVYPYTSGTYGTAVSSSTAAGSFSFPCAGYTHIRVRLSVITSGSFTVGLSGTEGEFPSQGGSGGGSGDASAANQATQITSLSSIDGKIPTKGYAAPTNSTPVIQSTVTVTGIGTTITTGGTAQVLSAAQTTTQNYFIQNNDTTELLWINISGGTAAANAVDSFALSPQIGNIPGGSWQFKTDKAVSVVAATTGHKICALRW